MLTPEEERKSGIVSSSKYSVLPVNPTIELLLACLNSWLFMCEQYCLLYFNPVVIHLYPSFSLSNHSIATLWHTM